MPTWPAMNRPGVPPAIVAVPSVPPTSITPAMTWPTLGVAPSIVMVPRLPATLTWAVVVIEPSGPMVREPRSPGVTSTIPARLWLPAGEGAVGPDRERADRRGRERDSLRK